MPQAQGYFLSLRLKAEDSCEQDGMGWDGMNDCRLGCTQTSQFHQLDREVSLIMVWIQRKILALWDVWEVTSSGIIFFFVFCKFLFCAYVSLQVKVIHSNQVAISSF